MSRALSLLILAGDGIGVEAMAQVERVIAFLADKRGVAFEVAHDLVGGAAIEAYGVPLTDAALDKARTARATLLGAVGGPQWDSVPYAIRPEAGLLKLRKELGLFANLRPATVFEALLDASALKPERLRGLDLMIVRELTGGIYFGEPRGIETLPDGTRRGVNTQVYTTPEIHRVARVAFELARKRQGRVLSAEKGNVMESGRLWREEVTALHAAEYSDVQLSHMYADALAMKLVQSPTDFDVIVTDNLFGDILSDEAAMLTGSLGMLPSASLGAVGGPAVYEPVHGSAPDIAGQDKANPLACMLSFAMALRYSLDLPQLAAEIETAIEAVLGAGIRTADIMAPGCTQVGTKAMGDAVLDRLARAA